MKMSQPSELQDENMDIDRPVGVNMQEEAFETITSNVKSTDRLNESSLAIEKQPSEMKKWDKIK